MTWTGIDTSCNPVMLKEVIKAGMGYMKRFWGLTPEDKEDLMLQVIYLFEIQKAKYPVQVYVRALHNKVYDHFVKTTAQKRMASAVVNGKRVYYKDLSLEEAVLGEEEDLCLMDTIPMSDSMLNVVELRTMVESSAPELLSILDKALLGQRLNKKERRLLSNIINKEDLVR